MTDRTGPRVLDQATTVGCPVCHAMPGDQCRASDGRTAGAIVHRARVTVWRAGFGPAADELGPDEAEETPTRLDDLERQVGELIEQHADLSRRFDLLQQGTAGLADIQQRIIELLPPSGPVDVGLSPTLPEDVPQRTRTGEDRPAGDLRERWTRGES